MKIFFALSATSFIVSRAGVSFVFIFASSNLFSTSVNSDSSIFSSISTSISAFFGGWSISLDTIPFDLTRNGRSTFLTSSSGYPYFNPSSLISNSEPSSTKCLS